MSNHDEQDLLTQALRDRAAGVGGHPIDMDAVRGRAKGIRRRRNAVRGVVAAMVATIAVPTGLTVTSALDSPDDSAPPPAASGTPSVSESAAPRPDGPVELTLEGLPQGEPPTTPYVVVADRQLVGPQGTQDLAESYSMMLPYDQGWVALGSGSEGYDLVMLDADLEETNRTPAASDTIVASRDGSQVAWAVRESPGEMTLFNAPADGSDPLSWVVDVPKDAMLRPVGFLDDDTVVYQVGGEDNEVATATVGSETTPVEGFIDVSDASDANGLVAGRTSYDDINGPGSCSGVKEPRATSMLWERCGVTIGKFSPDGQYVTAYPGYFDYAAPELYVLDARTGETVLELSPEKGTQRMVGVQQVAWEDGDSVLAVVIDENQQALVRADLDGSLELLTEPREENMTMQFWVPSETRG